MRDILGNLTKAAADSNNLGEPPDGGEPYVGEPIWLRKLRQTCRGGDSSSSSWATRSNDAFGPTYSALPKGVLYLHSDFFILPQVIS